MKWRVLGRKCRWMKNLKHVKHFLSGFNHLNQNSRNLILLLPLITWCSANIVFKPQSVILDIHILPKVPQQIMIKCFPAVYLMSAALEDMNKLDSGVCYVWIRPRRGLGVNLLFCQTSHENQTERRANLNFFFCLRLLSLTVLRLCSMKPLLLIFLIQKVCLWPFLPGSLSTHMQISSSRLCQSRNWRHRGNLMWQNNHL